MKRGVRLGGLGLAALALAGCQGQTNETAKNASASAVPANTAAPAPAGKATMDERFRGQWALNSEQCGKPGDGVLTVGADRVRFFSTSEGLLEEAQKTGKNRVEMVATVKDSSGEWRLYNTFDLSEDGKTLTVSGAQGQPARLTRCPAPQA